MVIHKVILTCWGGRFFRTRCRPMLNIVSLVMF